MFFESKVAASETRCYFQFGVQSIYLTVTQHRLNKEMSTAKAQRRHLTDMNMKRNLEN
jgi:hypothetical protein